MQDNDPIRRPCLGVTVNNPNRAGEEVCNLDGNLGLVLPMVDSQWIGTVAQQYPTDPCDGSFAGSIAPQLFDCPAWGAAHSHVTTHDGECPSGDSELGGQCQVPYDSGHNTSACINDQSMTPTFHTRPIIPAHGRVYNLFLTDGTTGQSGAPPVRYAQYPVPSTTPTITVDMAGAYNRIHQVESVVLPRPVPGCQLAGMDGQVDCLVNVDPCSIGVVTYGAPSVAAQDAVRVNNLLPGTPGYPL
jgi:hypothetical protein